MSRAGMRLANFLPLLHDNCPKTGSESLLTLDISLVQLQFSRQCQQLSTRFVAAIMVTAGGVSYRKIDPYKLSIFDLPAEVRENVYKEYFAQPESLYLHLIIDTYGGEVADDKSRVSAGHPYHALEEYRGYASRNGSKRVEYEEEDCSVEELLKLDQSELIWTGLESAAKSLQSEASRHCYHQTHFRVFGGTYGDKCYHSDLTVVP